MSLSKKDDKKDRRVQRSQQALQNALLQLMLEKGYVETSVADIVERANVGRSTFYAHFADKEDLLQQSMQGLKEFLTDESLVSPEREGDSHPVLSFALPMFMHAYQERRLFAALMGVRTGAPVQEHLQIMLTDLVLEKLNELDPECGESEKKLAHKLEAHFIVGAFLAVLLSWIGEPSDMTPFEIDREFRRLAMGGLAPLSGVAST